MFDAGFAAHALGARAFRQKKEVSAADDEFPLTTELENFMVDVADDGFQLTAELENVTEECSTDELADGMIQTEACNWGSPPTACSMDAVSDGGIFLGKWT